MKKIFLLLIALSYLTFADFSRVGQVVIDHKTNLMWQDNTTKITDKWINAINYCENLTLNGYSDWRLPNIVELASIVKFGNGTYPSIDNIFRYVVYGEYWSSTTANGHLKSVFSVNFWTGYIKTIKKDYYPSRYIRCVRTIDKKPNLSGGEI